MRHLGRIPVRHAHAAVRRRVIGHDARVQLERDVRRIGAEGVVIADMNLRVSERECPMQEGARDHIVETTIIGTSIVRFSDGQTSPGKPTIAVLSLDPQRRQAARVRI